MGISKPSSIYYAKRVSFLLSVLNSDDPQVRQSARYSFYLHMEKCKVDTVPENELNFGGFGVSSNGRIIKQSAVNWARSDFVELNELSMRLKFQLEFKDDTFHIVTDSGEDIHISHNDHRSVYA